MPFEDFKKKWKINYTGSAECLPTEEVTISGGEGEVEILCGGKSPYAKGKYNKETNTIVTDDYELRLQIEFKPKGLNSLGVSWTAEDQGPWPGDEQEPEDR